MEVSTRIFSGRGSLEYGLPAWRSYRIDCLIGNQAETNPFEYNSPLVEIILTPPGRPLA
jgi:hypothetical protein